MARTLNQKHFALTIVHFIPDFVRMGKYRVCAEAKTIKSFGPHLMPFLLVWAFVSVPLSVSMATGYRGFVSWYASHDYYFNIPENLFFLYYIRKTYRFVKDLPQRRAPICANLDFRWYRRLLIGLFAIVMLDLLCTFYEWFFPVVPWNIGTLIAFAFVALFVYLGIIGSTFTPVAITDVQDRQRVRPEVSDSANQPKKAISHLDMYSREQIEQLKANLFHILEHKKPHLNETLRLTDLAAEMDISPKKLSELLNQHVRMSFYDLVNEYRIREVMDRMRKPEYEKYTLAGLANECGFQSKATFNRTFKQKTGKSPSKHKLESANDACV